MGSSTSKPQQNTQQQKFSIDRPVRFSEGLIESLQNSSETDSTRAKNLELIIQQRVATELEKHLSAAHDKLSATSESISSEPSQPPKDSRPSRSSSQESSQAEKPLTTRISEMLFGKSDSDSQEDFPVLDRHTVSKEVDDLRKKLESRKKKVQLDKQVEKAKEELVICLRTNDRRPLDCWKEVENFKAEVGRLEKEFVHRNAG